ncbi:MAG TPA: hypothetical protein VGF01_02050 [Terracidiphilus sp.]|jgi:hypothetical protein
MRMGISQVDLAILLPAFAAAWNLVGGEKLFASHPASDRLHTSPDGFFAIEAPDDWELCRHEASNELGFMCGQVSVSVATAKTEAGDSVEQFLEFNKSLLRHMCPTAVLWGEGLVTVAGAAGAYFTMVCPGPRTRTNVRIAAARIQNRLLIFKTAAPTADLYAVQEAIDRMEQSLRVCADSPLSGLARKKAC